MKAARPSPRPSRYSRGEPIAAHQDRPAVGAHRAQLVLGDVERTEPSRQASALDRRVGRRLDGAHSIRLRPVSRRNTSSRLERRTRLVVGCRPSAADLLEHRLAVRRVDQHAVGQRLDALAEACEGGGRRRVALRAEPQLDHLARGVPADELGGRALGHDPAVVDDHQPVAQLLGLVHVVGGQHEGRAALLEPEQPVPQHVPGLRVQAGGRLVEHEHTRGVDQRACDGQPALHAAGQVIDLGTGLLLELGEGEQLVRPLRARRAGDAEVAAVHDEVVPDPQLGVEVVLLRDHSELGTDLRAVRVGVEAQHAEGPRRPGGHRPDHAHRRRLACAVGSEQPERLAWRDLQVDAVDRDEVAVALGQVAGGDDGGWHDREGYRPVPTVA